jgi:antitoxin VapB
VDKARLIMNGRSQTVRLPEGYHFEGKEVYIKRVPEGVLLIPVNPSIWDVWEENLNKYDMPFMTERNQPDAQKRDGLDKLFD